MTTEFTTSLQLTQQSKYTFNNGLQIPVTAFGVCDIPPKDTKHLVYVALKAGYRHIDSAMGYQNQRETAEAISLFLSETPEVARSDIFFTTKIDNNLQGYEETKQAVESIAHEVKQHIGYVDLVLLHSPKTSKEKRLGTYRALQEYVGENPTLEIKSLGVSNFGVAHLEELLSWDGLTVKPVLDQLELHPWLPHIELREYLKSKNILVEAYSPLTQGVKLNDPELLGLAAKHNINKAEMLLKWSFLQGFIVIAKSVTESRVVQNLNVLPADLSSGPLVLDVAILQDLHKPDSCEVMTWGNVDPTEFVDGE
ncbi:Aldo/keto reductase [Suhomyces tanzawaensis NRRL Y-17324]|uniref:2-dehydropantolactone reductase n=1 Tax=Suhomyces tanzawaensis NRRL Y-17324 TaxID=984487 RepID=A0A1E4SNP9_9ASCO|nr:Aldo/keto reductase [Suhomyces tanzawaensis NRRL Y-17324]ODV81141.1 Aldo/keto reductase [Suhomyces tanzawaensis NRRL Y-17324]